MRHTSPALWYALLLVLLVMPVRVSARAIGDLPTDIRRSLEQSGAPGASYAVFDQNGLVTVGAVGFANLATQQPLTPQTLMRAGSVTKILTAIAVLRLVEQGRFALDTPVQTLLPEAPIVNTWELTHPVRVIHLLEHSAGFDDTSLSKLFVPEESREGHLASLFADSRPLHTRWPPGTMMSYASPGYAVLAAILEKQTGQLWEDIIRAEVLHPLGMTNSVLTIAEAVGQAHAMGYRGAPMQAVPFLPMPDRAAGALWSTPEDLSKLGRFLMTDGRSAPGVLRPETVRDMKSVHSTRAAQAGLDWGYGLGIQRSASQGVEWLGHDGSVYGAGAQLRYQPHRNAGYVVMVNTDEVGEVAVPLAKSIVEQWPVANATLPTVEITGDVDGWYRRRDNRPELGAGINWLFGVINVWRNPENAHQLLVQELLSEPRRYHSPDNKRLMLEGSSLIKSVLIRDGERVNAIELNGGLYMERVSTASAVVPLIAGFLSVIALLTAPFGRRHALNNRWLRRLPTLALLSLLAYVSLLFQLDLRTIGEINAVGIGILICSLLLPTFALAGLGTSVVSWHRESASVAKIRCLLGSLGACCIALFFACFHGFALRIWQW